MIRRRINKEKDYDEQVLDIARVTRVVAGGKRMSFRATVAVGKKAEHNIGLGVAKGKDVAQAIEKATNKAKKNVTAIVLRGDTIPFEVKAKYKAARIILKPARSGRGIVAGGAVRLVLSLAHITNVSAKILGPSTNPINNARATILALSKFKKFSQDNKSETKPKQNADSSNKTKS